MELPDDIHVGYPELFTCKRVLADPLIDHKTVTNRTVSGQLGGEALRAYLDPIRLCASVVSLGPVESVHPPGVCCGDPREFAGGALQKVGQRPHGVGQAVRLVRGSAIRVGRQERRIRLDEQLVGGYQGGRLAQLGWRCGS